MRRRIEGDLIPKTWKQSINNLCLQSNMNVLYIRRITRLRLSKLKRYGATYVALINWHSTRPCRWRNGGLQVECYVHIHPESSPYLFPFHKNNKCVPHNNHNGNRRRWRRLLARFLDRRWWGLEDGMRLSGGCWSGRCKLQIWAAKPKWKSSLSNLLKS